MRDKTVATIYYKALVVLVRGRKTGYSRASAFAMMQRMVVRTAIDSAFDRPMVTNLLTLD